jgi:radical SAM-linked protein
VRFKHHACETSFLEGVFSRGDRRLCDVLERAWRNGARFDGWDEHFRLDAWKAAFRDEGVDPEFYAYTDLDPAGRLPWHVVHSRINRKWLAIELKRAMAAATLTVCGPKDCHGCAPFARDCVKGIVSQTTGRPLDTSLPLLSTPVAPGPGVPASANQAPPLVPRPAEPRPPTDTAPRYRYRAKFTKQGRMRYLGHLDLMRLVLRALRRGGVKLAYSQGFNPKPRVGFSPALPVGTSSAAEYIDFECLERLDIGGICSRVNRVLPDGVRFLTARQIRRDLPALGEAISAARYRARSSNGLDVGQALQAFRGRGPITVQRERKRGGLQSFELERELLELVQLDGREIRLTLAIRGNEPSVRPDEVLSEIFGQGKGQLRLEREELLVGWQGKLVNPILAASADHGG